MGKAGSRGCGCTFNSLKNTTAPFQRVGDTVWRVSRNSVPARREHRMLEELMMVNGKDFFFFFFFFFFLLFFFYSSTSILLLLFFFNSYI
jgi:hypothetical protein